MTTELNHKTGGSIIIVGVANRAYKEKDKKSRAYLTKIR